MHADPMTDIPALTPADHRRAIPDWPGNLASRCPILGLAGWSGAGKTTLLARLIPPLRADGLRLAVIKHAHHHFDVDYPGKDSYVLREAGALEILVSSGRRRVLIQEKPPTPDPVLRDELAQLDQSRLDLVLVEGFRDEIFPKLEVFRSGVDRGFRFPEDQAVLALASDLPPPADARPLPRFDLDDIPAILDFVRRLQEIQRTIL